VAADLADRFHCLALDFRGHGLSTTPVATGVDFAGLASDVEAVVDGLRLERPHGVGHSVGATALLLAEQARPGTFEAIWCWEPVIVAAEPPLGRDCDNWLAHRARRRQARFPSAKAARAAYAERPLFAAVRSDVLSLYIAHGFRSRPDGGVELRCEPETEASVYENATAHDCFGRLWQIACPVTLVVGGRSDAFPDVQAVTERLPRPSRHLVPDLGHLGPMEDPGAVARSVLSAFTDPLTSP